MKTIAFFGHSTIFNSCELKEKLTKTLNDISTHGYTRFLIGSHGDFDKIALSTCLNYVKNTNKNVTIQVVLTSLNLMIKDKYNYSKLDFYKEKNCETIFYDIEDVYYKNRITFSNKKMIDDSDLIICYVNMNTYKSGAKSAIMYAIKQNKNIINLF